jgi:hypothetical protein
MEFSSVETGFLLHAAMGQKRCGKKEVLKAGPRIIGYTGTGATDQSEPIRSSGMKISDCWAVVGVYRRQR